MTIRHTLRITTSSGEKYTSTPDEGTAAEVGQTYHRILSQAGADATISFPTTDGWVALRTRNIETIHLLDVAEEPEALADCGDEA